MLVTTEWTNRTLGVSTLRMMVGRVRNLRWPLGVRAKRRRRRRFPYALRLQVPLMTRNKRYLIMKLKRLSVQERRRRSLPRRLARRRWRISKTWTKWSQWMERKLRSQRDWTPRVRALRLSWMRRLPKPKTRSRARRSIWLRSKRRRRKRRRRTSSKRKPPLVCSSASGTAKRTTDADSFSSSTTSTCLDHLAGSSW